MRDDPIGHETLMFKLISIAVLIGAPILALLLRVMCGRGSLGGGGRWKWLAALAYVSTVLGLIVLSATAYYAIFATDQPLGNWALIVHVGLSPLLMAGLAGIAVLRGGRYGPLARPPWQLEAVSSDSITLDVPRGLAIRRALFWLFLLSGLVAMSSALVMMTPLTGTHGQELLLEIHRYGGLTALAFAIMHMIGPR